MLLLDVAVAVAAPGNGGRPDPSANAEELPNSNTITNVSFLIVLFLPKGTTA
jgi:hypothetical protein